MATGDYVIRRNNANTDILADTSGDLTLIWDTAVANVGSGITHSAGTFSLGETGRFLIMYSDLLSMVGEEGTKRVAWETRINFAGSDIIDGSCSGYIRGDVTFDYITSGCAIVNVATTTGSGDEFYIHHIRDDSTAVATNLNRVANDRSGVTIIKLDDTWNYGRYSSSADVTTSTTDNVATTLNIQTTDEQDSPFTRTTNSVDIATTNVILAVYTARLTTLNIGGTSRSESQTRLNLNSGTFIPGSWTQIPSPRHNADIDRAAVSSMCLIYPSSGDDLTFEHISRELCGDDYEASLALVELPSGVETIMVEATGGLFNEATASVFDWDTLEEIDTDAFTHTAGNSNIEVDNDGDYIVMANQAVSSDAGMGDTEPNRAVPTAQFRVNTTNNNYAGGATFNRASATFDHGSLRLSTLLTGLSATDDIHVWNDSSFSNTTGLMTCESGAFSVIRLSSLFAAGALISLSGTINIVSTTSNTALNNQRQLSSTIANITTTSDVSLSIQYQLSATIANVTTTSDVLLSIGIALSATITNVTTTSNASLNTQRQLSAIIANITTTSDVSLSIGIAFSATIANITTTSDVSLSIQYQLSATIANVTTTLDVSLGIQYQLSATIVNVTTTSSVDLTIGETQQEGFRFRNDDGSESAATWKANQDINVVIGTLINTRLRFLINTIDDIDPRTFEIQYKRVSDSADEWRAIPEGDVAINLSSTILIVTTTSDTALNIQRSLSSTILIVTTTSGVTLELEFAFEDDDDFTFEDDSDFIFN